MNRELWKGIGQIGDDLIADADESRVRNHFIRRKRTLWTRGISVAACLCLALCLCLPLAIMAIGGEVAGEIPNAGSEGEILITEQTPQDASLPWSYALAYKLRLERREYSPSEQPIVCLGYGLSSDALGGGRLKIDVGTGDFETVSPTEITVENFTYPTHSGREANELAIPLLPPKENSFGSIQIGFFFYPNDAESAEYAEYLSDGALSVGRISLSYVVNEYEIVFSQTNASDLFELRLVGLYESGIIGEKEFADRYFAFAYRDVVCASVGAIRADGSYNFIYRSKNIRYDSPYLTDGGIKEGMESADGRLVARLALEWMRGEGVITSEEYERELAWIEEAAQVGIYDIGFDQNVAKYAHNVLQKNMYTHG